MCITDKHYLSLQIFEGNNTIKANGFGALIIEVDFTEIWLIANATLCARNRGNYKANKPTQRSIFTTL